MSYVNNAVQWKKKWPLSVTQKKKNKKLSCHRETARRFVSLNVLLVIQAHSRSFEMTLLSRTCVGPY